MKRNRKYNLFGWLAVSALLLTTACADNALYETAQGDANGSNIVTFTVQPEMSSVATRAAGDLVTGNTTISKGNLVDVLVFAVYKKGKDDEDYKLAPEFTRNKPNKVNVSGGEFSVVEGQQNVLAAGINDYPMTIQLVIEDTDPDTKYKVVFWAQSSKTDAFDTKELTNIKVKYDNAKNNDEFRDAFTAVSGDIQIGTNTTQAVTLRRPFAQVNVGTAGWDYEAAAILQPSATSYTKSTITLDGVADSYNALTGKTSGKTSAIFDYDILPAFINVENTGSSFDYNPYPEEEFLKVNLDEDKKLVPYVDWNEFSDYRTNGCLRMIESTPEYYKGTWTKPADTEGDITSVKFTVAGDHGHSCIKGVKVTLVADDAADDNDNTSEYVFSEQGYEGGQELPKVEDSDTGTKITFDKGEGITAPAYDKKLQTVKVRYNSTMTVENTKGISKIELMFGDDCGGTRALYEAGILPATETFKYLSMCYVLVPEGTSESDELNAASDNTGALVDVNFTFKGVLTDATTDEVAGLDEGNNDGGNASGELEKNFIVKNVPVQKNWRTNILGNSFFTYSQNFIVNIVPEYFGDYNLYGQTTGNWGTPNEVEAKTYTVGFNNSNQGNTDGFFKFEGNHNFSNKYVGTYEGTKYSNGLKMEGSSTIVFETEYPSTVIIVQCLKPTEAAHEGAIITFNKYGDNEEPLDRTSAVSNEKDNVLVYTLTNVAAGKYSIKKYSGNSAQPGLFYVEVQTPHQFLVDFEEDPADPNDDFPGYKNPDKEE